MTHPRVMSEDWLPMGALGIEARRERAAPSALPPLSFLHVWWARRPLVTSAGVVLAGLLPEWTPGLADSFPDAYQLSSEQQYRLWLLHLVGIWGNPVASRRALDRANAENRRVDGNGYGYKQAFRNHPDAAQLDLLRAVLVATWGEDPLVADVTAGGGSIPFAAARLGVRTFANDLNSVAAVVLRSSVEYPAQYGTELLKDLTQWGQLLVDRVNGRIADKFPLNDGERITAYISASTVRCPRTGKLVPLVPDWTLRSEKGKEVAARLVVQRDGVPLSEAEYEIVHGADIDFDPKRGTVKRGDGLSPWDHSVIDGSYIKQEAQAGRMGTVLYAIAVRRRDGTRDFRAPGPTDLAALRAAAAELAGARRNWEASGVLPTEGFPAPISKHDIRPYGFLTWQDFFTPRQLLVHATFTDEYRKLVGEVKAELEPARAKAVLTLLALMQAKALNYNSRLSFWHQVRQTMGNTFARHDFSFKWTSAEFEGTALYTWSLAQLLDAYKGLANLMELTGCDVMTGHPRTRKIEVMQGNAADIPVLQDGTVAHLCMDPPYYDNVMYAELSDFFYVWEKRTVGMVAPELFPDDLADKDNEAVANTARFAHMGKRMRSLADADYEAKMTAIFTEARRVLREDGVLTVMFTHKRAEAWDTLGMGLLIAGFTIEASWPVNSEAEHSLHQSGLNSAASTIMLVCRKKAQSGGPALDVYLEDIEGEVRLAARQAVERFRADGIDGVDLLLSAYGPTLSVVSKHWPVYSSEADDEGRARLLRPEEALAIARAEIVRVQRARLVGHPIEFDPLTDFAVAFWDVIKDDTATYDEGRRLALAVGGLDVDELQRAKVLDKKAGTVRLLSPKERLRPRGGEDQSPGVRPQAESFGSLIDAVHTVCLVADEDGLGSAKALMDRTGLSKDSRFLAAVQALVNAVPRVRVKGAFVLPLAGSLDRVVTAYLPEVALPPDPVEKLLTEQGDLFADLWT